jgi:hypothetical protein
LARGGIIFVSKTAAVVLAFLSFMLLATISKAQLIQSGNVYVGVAYGDNVDVVNRYTFRGWNASFEAFPFTQHPHLSFVIDGTGYYRLGVHQYTAQLGPQLSTTYGKWRPFVHIMAGGQLTTSDGFTRYPICEDAGGGVDRKFQFLFMHHFSWRLQFDYLRTHLLSATQNDYRGSTGLVWRF